MRLYPDKLEAHFSRGLAPIYILSGDEPLGLMECSDRIRAAAKSAGFVEREVIFVDSDDEWSRLRTSADSLSLFAAQRLIELRLPTGKPGRIGATALSEYAQSAPPDIVLLITSARLERAQTNAAWYKNIDKVGVSMTFWPIKASELPAWIESRMRQKRLRPTRAAVQLVAERVEGNMLAAAQEVERLSLLFPEQEIDVAQALEAVANSARYSIVDCIDAAMQGAPQRAIKVLQGLRGEGVAPVLVLWSLAQEIRAATRIAQSLAAGMSPQAALKAAKVWQNRVPAMRLALSRHSEKSWLELSSLVAHADRVLKGQATGDVWEVMSEICARISRDGTAVIDAFTSVR